MAGRASGGAETYSTDVMLSLHKAGMDQCVVMSSKAPRYAEMKEAGVHLAPWVLAVSFRPLQKMFLRILIHREKPDVVHCWMRRAASLAPATRMAVVGWFGGYYDPRHFRRCGYFVGVTKDIVAHMIRHNVPVDRACFIPTFPDVSAASPVDRLGLATPKDAKILLALSRLHPKKGLDTLLSALKNIPNAYLWLAGEGPLRRELETMAKDLGLLERVRFLGWRRDRGALLRSADICVLPSRYEPFGTVILEAWAAGTPLVACRSAGPAAHIEDGETGVLVDINDAKGLTAAILRVLNDESLRRRLVAQGYAAYIKDYTREAVTQQWILLYQHMCKG